MKRRKKSPVFKPYDQNELLLIPPSWEEFIGENHPVRVVNEVIDTIKIDSILEKYHEKGRRNYHPKMLLKLLIYGYLCNIYSSRRLEEFAKGSIHCMWLTAMNMPDHNTINRFRSERLKEDLKQIFSDVVKLLIKLGHVSLRDVYVDGTKIEANANKYTFVWGRAIQTSRERIGEQLEQLWSYAEGVAKEELRESPPPDFGKIDAEMVKNTVASIDRALKEKSVDKKVKQKLDYGRKHWPENLDKYEAQEKILGERNSYSKTDPDATFMRLKEDHMLNGQLKPAYNVQVSTNDQIVINYSIHQKPTDTTTLPAHVEELESYYGVAPDNLIADAGYGSEENYQFLEQRGITGYVKYNNFDRDRRSKKDTDKLGTETLYYNQERDCYYCPMGQPMRYTGEKIRVTSNGYNQKLRVYTAVNCHGCPLRGACQKGQGNRNIEINRKLNACRSEAERLLISEKGVAFRKKRCFDVEPFFGNIKQNKGFRRFLLRGIDKVAVEIGLVALAHNLKKVFHLRARALQPKFS